MKRRLLSAFLAVMMVLTMAPVAFAADEGDAAPQSSVSLPANHTGDFTISEEGAVLDGTGVTYTDGTITVTAADVTIKNLTFGDKAKLVVNTSGKFTLTGCTFAPDTNNTQTGFIRTAVNLNVGEAEVTDNTFEGVTNGYYNAIEFGIGANNNDLKAATISGNTFKSAIANNYFNFYNMTNGAQIDIVNNKLLLAEKSSNGIRISNFRNATGVTFNTDRDEYTYATDSADSEYEGLILLQDYSKDSAVQNFSDITLNVTNLTAPESAKQLLYVYDDQDGIITTNQPKLTGDDSLAQFYAAKVGDTYYKTLAEAVSAANNNTVTLLKNTVENVVIPAGKTVTLDLNGNKIQAPTEPTDKKYDAIDNAGTLTVKDSKKTGEIVSTRNSGIGVYANSKTTIDYANITGQEGAVGGFKTTVGATVTINDGVFKGIDNAVVIFNGTDRTGASNEITINGGTFNGQIKSEGYVACGIYAPWNDNITVNGGIFNITGGAGIVARAGNVTVNGGEFNTTGNVTGKVGDSRVVVPCAALVFDSAAKYPALTNDSKIQIKDGKFKSDVDTIKVLKDDTDTNSRVVVGSGYFTTDPSAYCVTGKTGVTSDKDGYKYKVGTVEVKDENEIKTGTQEGTTQATLSGAIATDKQDDARKVGTSVKPTTLTDTTPITADDKAQALTELVKNNKVTLTEDGKIPENTTVTVVKETYLDVTVTGYNTENKTVSMDIVPKYNLIAVAKTGTNEEKVTLKSAQDAKVGSTEVEVTLPEAFKGQKVYINHNNGANLYVATADENGKITFTTNGFSPFTFALTNSDVVAEVNGNAYKSLKEAIDAAQTGATIVLQKDCTEKVTVAGKSLTINRNGKTFDEANVTVGSNCTKEVKNDTIVVTYTKPSSGSSGGSSSGKTTYKVTTSAVNNGGVNASPSNAEKGATITITLSPDKGYKMDKLTVTDGSGKTVSTVKKSDTVYTFTMPASAVKVGVSYVKATETPSETKFNDVSANDWFASAVDYVTGKGMMNGTADNTFSPKANTTRGMVVTVLYRLENQPSTSAASFTDVASGAYYANAVAWANANGIVSGYGSGKFGPNDKVTREQLAAILYRYAQYKKYDVSVGEDTNILSYDDAQSISSYAIPAIQWACGAGVVTGKSGSKLDPKGNATRAEVAAMLMRFCENVK